ncbi:hypothetical protein [Demequina salsinemoris]|uniref:hypothetical protein n=1 Tax=Demequina salsinemoris TaxID=577470 RepID=UPI00078436B7|nr:hypothetical protein [Demequina salsinemoris]
MDGDDDALLAALAGALEDDAQWSPGVETGAPLAALPGRHPGEALENRTHPVAGVRAFISDCGTSRLEGRTHVLLISEQAPVALGDAFADLAPAIAERVGSDGYTWEGGLHLHVTAPGRVWEDVLRTARDAVAALAAPHAEAG